MSCGCRYCLKRKNQIEYLGLEGDGFLQDARHFFTGNYNGENAFRKWVHNNGDVEITKIDIWREPVDSKITGMLNLITLGKFNPATENLGYDSLFHLSMVLNGMIRVEKNSVAKVSMGAPTGDKGEHISVPMHHPIKVRKFFDTAIAQMGEKNFFVYDAFSNNCQLFIKGILRANGLLTAEADTFIFQKAGEILKQLPGYTSAVAKTFTDLGSFFGAGIIPSDYVPRFDFNPSAPQQSFGVSSSSATSPVQYKYIPKPPAPTDGMTPEQYFNFLWNQGYAIQPRGKKIFEHYFVDVTNNFTQQQAHMLAQAKFNRDTAKAMEIMKTFNKVIGFILSLFPGGKDIAESITKGSEYIQDQLKDKFDMGKTNTEYDYSEAHMNALANNNLEVFKRTLSLWNPYLDLLAKIKTPIWFKYLQMRSQTAPDVSIFTTFQNEQMPRAILPPPDVPGQFAAIPLPSTHPMSAPVVSTPSVPAPGKKGRRS